MGIAHPSQQLQPEKTARVNFAPDLVLTCADCADKRRQSYTNVEWKWVSAIARAAALICAAVVD
jgi:RNase P subunit RPR2